MEHSEPSALMHFLGDTHTWVLVSFLLFFALFGKKLFSAMNKALDARSLRISNELQEARKLRQEAEELLATYRRKYQESMQEAESILAKAREDAGRMARDAQADLQAALAARSRMAQEKIAQAETRALQDVRDRVADLVTDAAKALIVENMHQLAHDELVYAAIHDIEKNKLH